MHPTAHVEDGTNLKIIEVDIYGKRGLAEYCTLVPEIEDSVDEAARVRILAKMHDFDGWDAGSLWETAKWDAAHYHHIERVAVVGEQTWQECATEFSKPFTTATVRYFTNEKLDAALRWLNDTGTPQPPAFWEQSDASGRLQR
jgi:hypothetical protein